MKQQPKSFEGRLKWLLVEWLRFSGTRGFSLAPVLLVHNETKEQTWGWGCALHFEPVGGKKREPMTFFGKTPSQAVKAACAHVEAAVAKAVADAEARLAEAK